MPKQPRWFKKPVEMFETQWGFRFSGEGVIYNREKSKNLGGEERIDYFVLTTRNDNILLHQDYRYMSQDMIRSNTEILNKFSNRFKRTLFEIAFKEGQGRLVEGNFKMLEVFLSAIEENPEIKKYF